MCVCECVYEDSNKRVIKLNHSVSRMSRVHKNTMNTHREENVIHLEVSKTICHKKLSLPSANHFIWLKARICCGKIMQIYATNEWKIEIRQHREKRNRRTKIVVRSIPFFYMTNIACFYISCVPALLSFSSQSLSFSLCFTAIIFSYLLLLFLCAFLIDAVFKNNNFNKSCRNLPFVEFIYVHIFYPFVQMWTNVHSCRNSWNSCFMFHVPLFWASFYCICYTNNWKIRFAFSILLMCLWIFSFFLVFQ